MEDDGGAEEGGVSEVQPPDTVSDLSTQTKCSNVTLPGTVQASVSDSIIGRVSAPTDEEISTTNNDDPMCSFQTETAPYQLPRNYNELIRNSNSSGEEERKMHSSGGKELKRINGSSEERLGEEDDLFPSVVVKGVNSRSLSVSTASTRPRRISPPRRVTSSMANVSSVNSKGEAVKPILHVPSPKWSSKRDNSSFVDQRSYSSASSDINEEDQEAGGERRVSRALSVRSNSSVVFRDKVVPGDASITDRVTASQKTELEEVKVVQTLYQSKTPLQRKLEGITRCFESFRPVALPVVIIAACVLALLYI